MGSAQGGGTAVRLKGSGGNGPGALAPHLYILRGHDGDQVLPNAPTTKDTATANWSEVSRIPSWQGSFVND